MASGDLLAVYTALDVQFRASASATLDSRNEHPVLDFDAAVTEEAVFPFVMPPHYGGGGVTVTVAWMSSTVAGGAAGPRWEGDWERHQDDAFDLDADGFVGGTLQGVSPDPPSLSGEVSYDDITFTDGAQIDSLAVNESGRFKLVRNHDHADDTMSGDAEMLRLIVKET